MTRKQYKKELKDARWDERRSKYKYDRFGGFSGWHCEKCGATEELQVHHKMYIEGLHAWEYPDDLLICLCDACHSAEHPKAKRAKRAKSAQREVAVYNDLIAELHREWSDLEMRAAEARAWILNSQDFFYRDPEWHHGDYRLSQPSIEGIDPKHVNAILEMWRDSLLEKIPPDEVYARIWHLQAANMDVFNQVKDKFGVTFEHAIIGARKELRNWNAPKPWLNKPLKTHEELTKVAEDLRRWAKQAESWTPEQKEAYRIHMEEVNRPYKEEWERYRDYINREWEDAKQMFQPVQ